MAFIYVRDLDSVVIGVHEEALQSYDGATQYEENWTLDNLWSRIKLVRNEDGTYFNTEEPHPDDNDGLI